MGTRHATVTHTSPARLHVHARDYTWASNGGGLLVEWLTWPATLTYWVGLFTRRRRLPLPRRLIGSRTGARSLAHHGGNLGGSQLDLLDFRFLERLADVLVLVDLLEVGAAEKLDEGVEDHREAAARAVAAVALGLAVAAREAAEGHLAADRGALEADEARWGPAARAAVALGERGAAARRAQVALEAAADNPGDALSADRDDTAAARGAFEAEAHVPGVPLGVLVVGCWQRRRGSSAFLFQLERLGLGRGGRGLDRLISHRRRRDGVRLDLGQLRANLLREGEELTLGARGRSGGGGGHGLLFLWLEPP